MFHHQVYSWPAVIARRDALKHRYAQLEHQYAALSLRQRRDCTLPFCAERFICAAILQCRPSTTDFQFKGKSMSETAVGQGDSELCPLWNNWFFEFHSVAAQYALKYTPRPPIVVSIPGCHGALTAAEGKLEDLEKIMREIIDHDALDHVQDINLPHGVETGFMRLWNTFNQHVASGLTIEETRIGMFRVENRLRAWEPVPQVVRQTASRLYFEFNPDVHFKGTWQEVNRSPSQWLAAPNQPKPATTTTERSTRAHTALAAYDASWDALEAHMTSFAYPTIDGGQAGLLDRKQVVIEEAGRDQETLIRVNTGAFFIRAFGMEPATSTSSKDTSICILERSILNDKVEKMKRQLKTKEMRRWHPD